MTKISSTVSIILTLVAAVLLVSVSNNVYKQLDITENKIFTLSKGTQKILSELNTSVTLRLYMTNLSGSNKAGYNEIEAHKRTISEFMQQYKEISKKIKLDIISVDPDSEEEDTAMRYGLAGSSLQDGTKIYVGLVAINDNDPDKEAVIPFISNSPEFIESLEYEITKIIVEVTTERKPRIGVISHFPVLGMKVPPELRQYQPDAKDQNPWAFVTALQYMYQLVDVSKEAKDINIMHLDGLLVIHPKEIAAETQFAIDQYLLNGGKVILFVDEISILDTPPQEANAYSYKRNSELNTLTDAWGLKRVRDFILCDRDLAFEQPYQNRSGQYEVSQNPSLLVVGANNILKNDRVTSGVQSIFMPYAASYERKDVADLKVEELLFSSKNNGDMQSFTAMASDPSSFQNMFDKSLTEKGPRETRGLAFRITGKFKTAFPEGQPKAAENKEEGKSETPPAKEFLKESKGNPVAIVVTDVDMLNDRIMFRQDAFGRPTNSNFTFTQNLIEYTMGNEDLISIRTKSISNRPFTVLENIRLKAQENTQKEIRAYEEKEAAASEKLSNLQVKTENGQLKISLTPEQAEEAKKLREQMAETKKQIRKLQFQQRKDVENKIFTCKLFNFLLAPGLILVLGLSMIYIQSRKVR